MISDEEIKSLKEKCRYSPTGKEFVIDERQLYRAIYQLGRQHQRESDAALCRDAADKYMERFNVAQRCDAETSALTSHAAATCLESAIRANTGEQA